MRTKNEAKRLAILEAGKSVFLERGFEATSMAEISARARCSKQTLYSYFSSKDDLFVAVMLEMGATIANPLFDGFDDDKDLPAALRTFAIRFLHFMTTSDVLAMRRIVYAEGARSQLGKLFFENGPKRGWTRVAQRFERAMDAGQMRKSDAWVAAQHFHGLCEAGPFQYLLEGAVASVSDAELAKSARDAVDVFIRAYDVRP